MKKEIGQLSDSEYKQKRAKLHEDEANYVILKGEQQAVRGLGGVWDTDYMLTKYLDATDKITSVLDGSTKERDVFLPDASKEEKERAGEKPDIVIYLDKSARPVEWFVDAMWEQLAENDAKKPTAEFLNIDRVDWLTKQGNDTLESSTRLGAESFDIEKVSDEEILGIRAIFSEAELTPEDVKSGAWMEKVKNSPAKLDNQNILIVDEVKNRGGTMSIALQLIKKAFPTSEVSGQYFWPKVKYALGGDVNETQMETVPVWYDAHNAFGRGVGDISKDYYDRLEQTSDNIKKQLGWFALSAPHYDMKTYETIPDQKAIELQQDIAYASYALGDGKIAMSVNPERFGDDGQVVDRRARQQGFDSVRQLTNYMARRNNDNAHPDAKK